MAYQAMRDWFTYSLSPSVPAILVTALLCLILPLLLHLYSYRQRTNISLPTFLLVGPSGSGKTSLLTLLERGSPSLTHISQAPLTVQLSLPVSKFAASSQFRSINDPTNDNARRFLLADTPGHGKLRHFATNSLINPHNLRGIIFLVDASNLSPTSTGSSERGLTEAAQYLHDILLTLQKRYTQSKSSKGPSEVPVLVAVNKLDLFTALPVRLVKSSLESEITSIRTSRTKGLQDSGVGMGDDVDEERDWLGDYGGGKFEFSQMMEFNTPIEVAGGNVTGADGHDIDKWWDWIANHI